MTPDENLNFRPDLSGANFRASLNFQKGTPVEDPKFELSCQTVPLQMFYQLWAPRWPTSSSFREPISFLATLSSLLRTQVAI